MAGRVAVAVVAEGACPGRRPMGAVAVPVAVVAEGACPGRRPVGAVAVPVGVGVDNANTVARSGVVTSGSGVAPGTVASSAAGGAAPIAVTNAPAATHAETAAGTRHATPSARADSWAGNAAAGAVATKWRGGDGQIRGWQPAVVVTANGVDTPAAAAGVRWSVRAGGRRRGGAPTGRRAARPVAGRCRWGGSVDGGGNRVAAERGDHAGETPEAVRGAGGGAPLRGAPQVVPRGVHCA